MKSEHVIKILESGPLAALSQDELDQIRAHAAQCGPCHQSYQAALVSAVLLHERAASVFEPSPFFATRVLAELRGRQTANERWAWTRLWHSAGGLAASMLAAVATLAVLTFVVPGAAANDASPGSAVNAFSTEAVVFDQTASPGSQVSDSDVFATLYGAEEDVVK